jgi:EAL domain-containing protein (putative c-di-GMP-specific phosphodiesterase class I)
MRLLRWPEFRGYLADLVGRYPTKAALRLELDMDDNAPLSDLTLSSRIIEDCNKLGVGFVLDHFGSGYSSLTYLKYLPAQCLKIDGSLVSSMLANAGDMAMVESILGLAKAFQRKVIADGVVSQAQAQALWSRGCYSAQGPGVALPMSTDDLSDWFANYRLPAGWTCPDA